MTKDEFLAAAFRNPVNEAIAEELWRLALPDAWIVSGCLVQTVWNVLTARAVDYGIDDYDIFYFDADTSWQAEDAVIRQVQRRLAKFGVEKHVGVGSGLAQAGRIVAGDDVGVGRQAVQQFEVVRSGIGDDQKRHRHAGQFLSIARAAECVVFITV